MTSFIKSKPMREAFKELSGRIGERGRQGLLHTGQESRIYCERDIPFLYNFVSFPRSVAIAVCLAKGGALGTLFPS